MPTHTSPARVLWFFPAVLAAVWAAAWVRPGFAASNLAPGAAQARPQAPHTPPGLPACTHAVVPATDLPRAVGEVVRYLVEVNGISVGTVDFKIARNADFQGQPATEYRSHFKLDALVSLLLPAEGRAASIVPAGGYLPVRAMSRYVSGAFEVAESVSYEAGARALTSERSKGTTRTTQARRFPTPAPDFVSMFYAVRRWPARASGCALVYGNQRGYTMWVDYDDAIEEVYTPVGPRKAERYRLRYASEKSKQALTGAVWLARDASRLPYRAEVITPKDRVVAQIHMVEPGGR